MVRMPPFTEHCRLCHTFLSLQENNIIKNNRINNNLKLLCFVCLGLCVLGVA